jgi:hypothetical protein
MILSYIFLKGIYKGKVVDILMSGKAVPVHFIGQASLFEEVNV